MSRAPLREFERQFRSNVVAALSGHGFMLGEARTFRRALKHEQTQSSQIIEFQIGRKGSSIGRFTVNLAVFNRDYLPHSWSVPDGEPQSPDCLCDLVQRLGFFRQPHRSVVDRALSRYPKASDHWWRQSDDPQIMHAELAEVMNILLAEGFQWLNTRTSLVSFRWALRQLERRKEWKAALGTPDASRLFTVEPFPVAECQFIHEDR